MSMLTIWMYIRLNSYELYTFIMYAINQFLKYEKNGYLLQFMYKWKIKSPKCYIMVYADFSLQNY